MQPLQDAATSPDTAPMAALQLLSFRLGGEEYGIDIQKVSELRGYDKVTCIASAPTFVKGVINLRGNIVQIVDLRIRFDLGEPTYDAFTVVIVLQVSDREIGVVVDSVSDVVTLARDQIKAPPQIDSTRDIGFVTGIGTINGRMLILLDVDKLLVVEEIPTLADAQA